MNEAQALVNFRAWYVNILEMLYPHRNAGITIFMITLPLAERYSRQKNGLDPTQPLTDACMSTLVGIFPVLRDVQRARVFWNVFRNGFLHQATLNSLTRAGAALPIGYLIQDIGEPIEIRPDGSMWVHPVLFSKKIVQQIEADFATFAGSGSRAPGLPIVERLDRATIPSVFWGTRPPP